MSKKYFYLATGFILIALGLGLLIGNFTKTGSVEHRVYEHCSSYGKYMSQERQLLICRVE